MEGQREIREELSVCLLGERNRVSLPKASQNQLFKLQFLDSLPYKLNRSFRATHQETLKINNKVPRIYGTPSTEILGDFKQPLLRHYRPSKSIYLVDQREREADAPATVKPQGPASTK